MKVKLDQRAIVDCMIAAETVQTAIDNLYRQVFRMYDDLDSMDGYPVISQATADYIYKAGHAKFDSAFLVGWISRGMQIGDCPDWQVDISGVKLRWSKKMKADTAVFNSAIRIRFSDHLDNLVIILQDKPEEI